MLRYITAFMCVLFMASPFTAGQLKERADLFKSLSDIKGYGIEDINLLQSGKANTTTIIDSSLYQEWLFDTWQNKQSSVFSYSQDNKDKEVIFRTFESNHWNEKTRTKQKFDDSQNLIWESVELFSNNEWKFIQQTSSTYTNGLPTEEVTQSWNNDAWVNYVRHTSKYDDSGNETELLVETWADGWTNTYRYTSVYDQHNNNTNILAEVWDNGWRNNYKVEYVFNELNQQLTYDYYQWVNETWQPVESIERTYGTNHELKEAKVYQWLENKWLNKFLTQYLYINSFEVPSETVHMNWNTTTGKWENNIRYLYSAADTNHTETITQLWNENEWVNNFKSIIENQGLQYISTNMEWKDSAWVNSARFINYYKLVTSVNDEVRPATFKLEQNFPNPFNPSTTISYSVSEAQHVSLKVYNILGQLVSTLVNDVIPSGTHKVQFNAAGLSSGIYYYRIETAGVSETKGMMLLK